MVDYRRSGILLHISSIPSEFGIGDFGKEAFHFIDLLAKYGITVWQILPLGPAGAGNSPYQAYSAYAGDPRYISPERIVEWGLLTREDITPVREFCPTSVNFKAVTSWKAMIHKKVWNNFILHADESFKKEYGAFLGEHDWWLSDYALYASCSKNFDGLCWNKWEKKLVERDRETLERFKLEFQEDYEFERFQQFIFFKQWFQLKEYANEKGVKIFGDIPLYVSLNSSDIWTNQELFLLDENREPTLVGGVPPDYFSEKGQLWGNPVFNWDQLRKTGYNWWIARLYFNLHMFDMVRIDHFRGLESFWAVEAGAENAISGQWLPADGNEILQIMQSRLGEIPVVAEDLGIITPEVEQLRDRFNLPGMKVLQFAFSSDSTNDHLPHNFQNRVIAYTGTHDNDTIMGWWKHLSNQERKNVLQYLSLKKGNIKDKLIEWIWSSTATVSIVPMQDILGLGSEARMNIPGTATGNWQWRYTKHQLKKHQFEFIQKLNILYNRK